MNQKSLIKLRKLVKKLEKIRGRHTELISLYIPSGYSLQEIIGMLRQEYALTQNVKSKATRTNVLGALEKTMNHLRQFKQTPKNGLIIFCGNVSGKEGQTDIQLWSVEPPQPLAQKIYWCDQTFVLDPLKDMLREREVYGLIVLDSNAADVGFLKGKKVLLEKHLDSLVPGKTTKGGWCISSGSLVSLSNGETIKVEKLAENKKILVYDFEKKQLVTGTCEKIQKRSTDWLYVIETKNNRIELTGEHRVFVSCNGVVSEKYAEDLNVGDTLFAVNSNSVANDKIKKIQKIQKKVDVYDISVPKYNNFIANSLIIHNSQQRYSRIRDEAIHKHMKKTGEIANRILKQEKDLKGVIIGGPGPLKEKFNRGEFLDYKLKEKRLGVVDTSYTGIQGLQEIVKRGEALLREASAVKERKLMEEFFGHLQKDDGLSVYGLEQVKRALRFGAVDTLLLSEEYDWVRVKLSCQCGKEIEKDAKPDVAHKCPNCGAEMSVESENELIDVLSEQAKNMGSSVELISVDSREGEQFKELGGIGAILRFKIE